MVTSSLPRITRQRVKFFLLVSSLLLTACATDPSWPYVRPDTSAETRRADFKSCQAKTGGLSVVFTGAAVADHVCMTNLGYTQEMWGR